VTDPRVRGEVEGARSTRWWRFAGVARVIASLREEGARKRRWQIAGYALGVVLFVAAIFAVVTQGDTLAGALSNIRGAPVWLIALAFVLPALNWLVVSVSLWVLMRAYGRIGLGEMTALIANAWLLNYFPMRPGMAGRITYHKLINRIRVRDSAKAVLQATAMTGISIVVLGAMAIGLADRVGLTVWWIALTAPAAVLAVGIPLLRTRPFLRRMTIAMLFRHVDMMVWVARYWVVFALIDAPIGLPGAVGFAVLSQVALLVPFTGNGLGVREWVIGHSAASGRALGLTADLINRAAELVVSIPTGLVAAWWVARRLARYGEEHPEAEASSALEEPLDEPLPAEIGADRP